ncbi:MAG: hypothetical protein KAX27_06860 [Candidatus Aminicenantes bacterium]|nr:hypothetical protein [Candidatus Aminicenantes bacterium]
MSKILGIDIGSLTIKAAAYDPLRGKVEELEIVDHKRQPVQRAFGASSGNCCYLIKYAQQVIIFKQVKHNRMARNMPNEV